MNKITSKIFGKTSNGEIVTAYTIKNDNQMSVTILDYGCTVQSIVLPDKDGIYRDIILGYDDVSSYEKGTCFFGAVVGRYANRIGGAYFYLDNQKYDLEKTLGENNHVHGVFAKRLFKAKMEEDKLILKYRSPHLEEGFPGNLDVEVTFSLNNDNELEISYLATTDRPTILNLTSHCYFNLNGQDGSTIFDHILQLNCSYYSEYNEDFSQTGKIIPVINTPLDFKREHTIGERFKNDYHQFNICTGYDHNMIIDGKENELKKVGTCKNNKTGLILTMYTTEPAIQLYSSNYISYDAVGVGKNGVIYPKNGAICFEAQHYPDSPRHNHFPNVILRENEQYRQKTIYQIKVMK